MQGALLEMAFLRSTLESLPEAAAGPLAFIALLATVGAWLWYVYKRQQFEKVSKQVAQVLKPLGDVPKAEMAKTIRECLKTVTGVVLPADIDPEQYIRGRKHQYFLVAFLALLFFILALLQSEWVENRMSRPRKPTIRGISGFLSRGRN